MPSTTGSSADAGTPLRTPGTFRAWAMFSAIVGGVALACDGGAALAGRLTSKESVLPLFLGVAGALTGAFALGAACLARAYWTHGDGCVPGRKRLWLGCALPLVLVVLLCLTWTLLWPLGWYLAATEPLWLYTTVGPLLALTVERLAGPFLFDLPRGPGHSSASRPKSTS